MTITQVITWLNSQGADIDAEQLSYHRLFSALIVSMNLVSYGLSILRVLFTNMFLILLTVLFILLETSGFPGKLQAAFPDPNVLSHFQTMRANVNRYMGLKALISLATGVSIWILLALIGVDFPGDLGVAGLFSEVLYPGHRLDYRRGPGSFMGPDPVKVEPLRC